MDIVSMIQTALAAGAAAAVSDTVSQTAKDAYQWLKAKVSDKLAGEQGAESMLEAHEQDPQTWAEPLKAALVRVGAEQDQEIVTAAQRVLNLSNPQQAAMGKYATQVGGNVQGFVQGDNAQVTMNFGGEPKEKP